MQLLLHWEQILYTNACWWNNGELPEVQPGRVLCSLFTIPSVIHSRQSLSFQIVSSRCCFTWPLHRPSITTKVWQLHQLPSFHQPVSVSAESSAQHHHHQCLDSTGGFILSECQWLSVKTVLSHIICCNKHCLYCIHMSRLIKMAGVEYWCAVRGRNTPVVRDSKAKILPRTEDRERDRRGRGWERGWQNEKKKKKETEKEKPERLHHNLLTHKHCGLLVHSNRFLRNNYFQWNHKPLATDRNIENIIVGRNTTKRELDEREHDCKYEHTCEL